jgi:CMP-N-acetylneuraminic acid synthetase
MLDRPENLRGGKVSMNQVLLHDVEEVVSQFYLQTHSTNPLLSPATIQQAIETFFEGYPEYDSLFSVTRVAKRLWDGEGKPVNHDPRILLRTQDLPPLYEENSCLYIFERETFIRRKNRLGEKPLLFEIDHVEAWDIDEEFDFQVVNHLIRSK